MNYAPKRSIPSMMGIFLIKNVCYAGAKYHFSHWLVIDILKCYHSIKVGSIYKICSVTASTIF